MDWILVLMPVDFNDHEGSCDTVGVLRYHVLCLQAGGKISIHPLYPHITVAEASFESLQVIRETSDI